MLTSATHYLLYQIVTTLQLVIRRTNSNDSILKIHQQRKYGEVRTKEWFTPKGKWIPILGRKCWRFDAFKNYESEIN